MEGMYISEYNAKFGTNYANYADLKNAQLYVINGYIVDAFDAGKHPTKQEIMQQWQYWHGKESREFTYMDVEWIIAKVAKFYIQSK